MCKGILYKSRIMGVLFIAVILLALNCKNIVTAESKDTWVSVPFVDQKSLDNGYLGGEGCQWGISLTFDEIDGTYAYMGNDVAGIYRSSDGGKTWSVSTLGFDGYGAVGIKCDPTTNKVVMAVGTKSSKTAGLYISRDSGETWKGVLNGITLTTHHDFRTQIAYDKTSANGQGCQRIYWLTEKKATENTSKADYGLYMSEDGGEHFDFVSNTESMAGGQLVSNEDGVLVAAGAYGIYLFDKETKTFSKCFEEAVNSVDVVGNTFYFLRADGIYKGVMKNGKLILERSGDIPEGNAYPDYIEVSRTNPQHILMQFNTMAYYEYGTSGYWAMTSYYSMDGGKSWKTCSYDGKTNYWAGKTYANREKLFAVSPTDDNVVLSFGGDCIMRSTNGGADFSVSSEGYSAIYIGGNINFNVNDANLLSVASQDYNGGFSTDGGRSFKYINWSGQNWGGYTYGSYALNKNTVITGVSNKWNYMDGAVVKLAVTRDGGNTVTITDCIIEGSTVGMGAVGNDKIAFLGEWRTVDGAQTFSKMDGCSGVFTADYETGRLFGFDKESGSIVYSDDNGETFTIIPGKTFTGVKDIAYNPKTKSVYVANFYLNRYDFNTGSWTEIDRNFGLAGINGICVDPDYPDIMYATYYQESTYTKNNVARSTDGGKSWTIISRSVGDGRSGPDGANAAKGCRVNKNTGEVFVYTHCYGLWKMARPDIEKNNEEEKGNSTTEDKESGDKEDTEKGPATTEKSTTEDRESGKKEGVEERPATTEQAGKQNEQEKKSANVSGKKAARPKDIKVKNSGKGKIFVSWSKVKGVSGYQITYSTSKKFKKSRKKYVTRSKKSITLKKLRKGKVYYIKVRAYKLNSKKKKSYGSYSIVKKIKVKR